MRFSTTTILAMGLLAAVPVTAQNDGTTAKPKQEKSLQPMPTLVRAGELVGSKVRTGTQEEADTVGTLDDIIVNASTGQVLFGVLSTGGFLGVGETLTAVPCELLVLRQRPGSDKPILVLDTTKQKLSGAPKFDAARLEHCLGDDAWRKETIAAFGSFPKLDQPVKLSEASGKTEAGKIEIGKTEASAVEASAKVSSYRMGSKLRGATLRGSNDKIGSVDDLIIDRDHHMITYAIVDDSPLPWNVLSLRDNDLYVAKTKEAFKSAPKLEKDAVARLGNPEFCARVKSFYAVNEKN